jgi:photosystem II stability/assembly factor-like uncharacterized protein
LSVFFQAGDLPETVKLVQFDNTIPDLALKLGGIPDGAANLSFKMQSGNVPDHGSVQIGSEPDYGNVMLLHFRDPGLLQKASQRLLQSDQAARQAAPQAGIGDIALLFLPGQPGEGTALDFQVCHSFVQIRLFSIADPAILLRYAGRLAERLQRLDCQGSSTIPLLTPPPPLLAPTAIPPIPITQGYTQVQRLPDPDGATSLRAYAFADPQHGWLALGTNILITVDGGKTWQPQTTTDGKVEQIWFESAQIGWILTDKGFLVTQDGGASWQKSDSQPADTHASMPPPPTTLLPPDQLQSFAFCPSEAPFAGVFTSIDTRTGWVFCTSHPMDHFNTVQLFQTRDGGQHWQLLLGQAPYGRYGASNLFFLDDQHGWLAVQAEGGSSLYATTDGGRTWQPVGIDQIGIGAPANARSVHFLSLQVGFVILSNSSYNQGRDVLLGTRDGGGTWQEVFDAPAPAPWPDGPFQVFADGHGIGFEQDEGIVLEDTPLITADWGKTWTPSGSLIHVAGCSAFYESITGLSFPDQAHGWATLSCGSSPSTSILYTVNGGKTWNENSAPVNSSTGFVGVSFPSASTGYLVSQAGFLFRTIDAGRSFSPVDKQAVHTRSLQFATPLLGWEVRGTNLFETTDGGSSWQPVPFPMPVQYFALLPNNSAWVIAGQTTSDNGMPPRRVFTTTDGGKSWTELPFGEIPSNYEYPWLDGIQFANDLHGWLRGGTALFFTEVGGKTWIQVH